MISAASSDRAERKAVGFADQRARFTVAKRRETQPGASLSYALLLFLPR